MQPNKHKYWCFNLVWPSCDQLDHAYYKTIYAQFLPVDISSCAALAQVRIFFLFFSMDKVYLQSGLEEFSFNQLRVN